ncbi:ND2 [Clunio marinus]|uniref:NADH-ubiquinone oxidoreductase chain 2 n=1 Tax=Clunio marinus TaxID=568069 RepID=A0A1J1J8M3_9DIPT|nr:ND2 [Clunio marinus]
MLNNSYKMLFLLFMMIGTMISISSISWISMWMGLEINLLSFIPLMMSSKNLFSSESSLKYFLIQALASSIFFFSILLIFLMMNLKSLNFSFINLIFLISILLKMGAAPFHFWLPSVMEGLKWMNNFLLMTWQKMAPLMIISLNLNYNFIIFCIINCVIFGSLGGLNQTSLRKLLAFSSINHLGWILSGMLFNEKIWMNYFYFYIFLNFSIILMFKIFNLYFINQVFLMKNLNLIMKLFLFINLLSLGGLPPFLGFFPKWMIIELMMKNNSFFILLIIMFFSLITLYFYLRLSYSMFLFNHKNVKWNTKNIFNLTMNYKLLFMISFFSLMNLLTMNFFYFFF